MPLPFALRPHHQPSINCWTTIVHYDCLTYKRMALVRFGECICSSGQGWMLARFLFCPSIKVDLWGWSSFSHCQRVIGPLLDLFKVLESTCHPLSRQIVKSQFWVNWHFINILRSILLSMEFFCIYSLILDMSTNLRSGHPYFSMKCTKILVMTKIVFGIKFWLLLETKVV